MAAEQRDISVSEFFAKNRHLLGFDNPRKALLTTVKEAVDNSLDACEEAGILPELRVEIVQLLFPIGHKSPSREPFGWARHCNSEGVVDSVSDGFFWKFVITQFSRLGSQSRAN